jgi:hypothetical protein
MIPDLPVEMETEILNRFVAKYGIVEGQKEILEWRHVCRRWDTIVKDHFPDIFVHCRFPSPEVFSTHQQQTLERLSRLAGLRTRSSARSVIMKCNEIPETTPAIIQTWLQGWQIIQQNWKAIGGEKFSILILINFPNSGSLTSPSAASNV